MEENKRCAITLTGDAWQSLSLEAQDLVSSMLNRDQFLRPTAKECLQHPWLSPKHPHSATVFHKAIKINIILTAEYDCDAIRRETNFHNVIEMKQCSTAASDLMTSSPMFYNHILQTSQPREVSVAKGAKVPKVPMEVNVEDHA